MFGKNVIITCISSKQYMLLEAAKLCTLWFLGLYIVGKIEERERSK